MNDDAEMMPLSFARAPGIARASFQVASVVACVICASSLIWLLANIDRGLDLTDEAYYLLWIDRPADYGIAPTTFGFFLSPIYHLLGSDPAALRRFGVLATSFTSCTTLWAALLLVRNRISSKRLTLQIGVLSLYAAATTVSFYYRWLPTPSYNWLPLPAAFLLVTSLLLLHTGLRTKSSAFLTGLAGMLAFGGKPTTAVGFFCIYVVSVLVVSGFSRVTLRHMILSGASCIVLFGLAAITFIDPRIAFEQAQAYVGFFGAAPATGDLFVGWRGPWGYYAAFAATAIAYFVRPGVAKWFGFMAVVAFFTTVFEMWSLTYVKSQGVLIATASLMVTANCFAWSRYKPDRETVTVLSMTHILPWVMSFGTGNALYAQMAAYAALPAVGAFVVACLCFDLDDWRIAVTGLLAGLMAVLALYSADIQPYRLKPGLFQQDQPVAVDGGWLRVDTATAKFINTLREDANRAGFTPETMVLDFTGDTPGVAYLLGGKPPIFPWVVGGYAFSDAFAALIVSRLSSEQRDSAWLVHSDKPRPFKKDFLRSLGFDIDNDYDFVSGPMHPIHGTEIRLYAPRNRVRRTDESL